MMMPTPSSRPPMADTLWQVILASLAAGGSDAWVIKLDARGNVQWQKTYGGKYDDEVYFIDIVRDETFSFDTDMDDALDSELDEAKMLKSLI